MFVDRISITPLSELALLQTEDNPGLCSCPNTISASGVILNLPHLRHFTQKTSRLGASRLKYSGMPLHRGHSPSLPTSPPCEANPQAPYCMSCTNLTAVSSLSNAANSIGFSVPSAVPNGYGSPAATSTHLRHD